MLGSIPTICPINAELPNALLNQMPQLLPHADAKRLHLAIKMASFQPQQLRRVAHIVPRLLDLLQNVLALISIARLLQ